MTRLKVGTSHVDTHRTILDVMTEHTGLEFMFKETKKEHEADCNQRDELNDLFAWEDDVQEYLTQDKMRENSLKNENKKL